MALGTLCTLVQSVHCAKAQHWQGDRGSGADIQATPPTKTHSLFNPNNRGTEAQLSFHCPPQTTHMALRPSAACGPWDLLSLLAHCVGKAFSLGAESRPTIPNGSNNGGTDDWQMGGTGPKGSFWADPGVASTCQAA